MITETPTRIIVLQLTNELVKQLQPFLAGLDFTACTAEHTTQRLTMRSEVYELLAERVGGALDYEVRWQPNEYALDGFVEHVRPLELTNGVLVSAGCPQCGAQILANHADVACACGQAVALTKRRHGQQPCRRSLRPLPLWLLPMISSIAHMGAPSATCRSACHWRR